MNRSMKRVVRSSKRANLGPCGALALSLSVLAACQSEGSDDSGSTASGGASTGGAPAGGTGTGGSVGVGGASTGGVVSGSGGLGSGGVGTGGIGGGTGGAATGGAATGGTGTGGANTGGTATGGTSTGGAATGGTGTGGASDPSCSQGVWDGGTPEVLSLTGNTFAHDPTMIEANGVFYRFWTGNDIPMAKSTDLKNWTNGPSVYTSGYSQWTTDWLNGISGETFNFPWAPDVSYFGGKYHIYSSFSAKFGDNISCITHLSTSNIAQGGWTDHGPVICTKGNENYNAIDADVGLDEDGTPWLAFGSFWNGIMGIRLNADGSRAGTDMTRLAWASQIEAPVLFHRCGYYYLFVTWGLCCPGEGRSVNQLTYRVAVGRSENIMGPYVDRDGKNMVDGGGTLLVQGDKVQWAAAGHSDVIATGDKIYHLYHAYRQSDGGAQLRIVELPFDDEGWPVPGGP